MRIKNKTSLNDTMLKQVLSFASRGIKDTGVEVWIDYKFGKARFWGEASSIWFHGLPLETAKSTEHLIKLRVPRPLPDFYTPSSKKLWQIYPHDLPLESVQDYLVAIAAHEFKHISQFRSYKKLCSRYAKTRKEYAADKYAFETASKWRVQTGREPLRRVRLDNPFIMGELNEISY